MRVFLVDSACDWVVRATPGLVEVVVADRRLDIRQAGRLGTEIHDAVLEAISLEAKRNRDPLR